MPPDKFPKRLIAFRQAAHPAAFTHHLAQIEPGREQENPRQERKIICRVKAVKRKAERRRQIIAVELRRQLQRMRPEPDPAAADTAQPDKEQEVQNHPEPRRKLLHRPAQNGQDYHAGADQRQHTEDDDVLRQTARRQRGDRGAG